MSDKNKQEKNKQQTQQPSKKETKPPFSLFQPVQIKSDSWEKSAAIWNSIFNERGGISQKERD